MSRAVIDQQGFKVVFVGLFIALLLGLTLKAQIAPHRLHALLQGSVNLLEKDFIIDFKKVEIVLSKWGLPLPYLQISQIRVSPKKASCQDTQMYIENLILPISPMALMTSQTLVREISATQVELRLSDLNNCFQNTKPATKPKEESATASTDTAAAGRKATANSSTDKEVKNVFQIKTSALLEKIKVEQLKVIFKKNPMQPISLRQAQIELIYDNQQLERIQAVSQIYALKDQQSDLMFFKGELTLQMISKNLEQFESQADLRGRLLDGEIQVYSIYNSLEQGIKMDFKATNMALKPLIQLNLFKASWLNYPVALNFRGYGQYQVDGSRTTILRLKDIFVVGEQTQIRVPEINLRRDKDESSVDPFIADIQRLNLNKLSQVSQMKNVSQSVENFGEINGVLSYKNKNSMTLSGTWSGLEFIFSNRGLREMQRIDSFKLQGQLLRDVVHLKFNKFIVNQKDVTGRAELNYNQKNSAINGEAQLEGELLNGRVWELLTQVPQSPAMRVTWTYKKQEEERHQILMSVQKVNTPGVEVDRAEVNYIHSLIDGQSSSVALSAKLQDVVVGSQLVNSRSLKSLLETPYFSSAPKFTSEQLNFNFKGINWKNISYEAEGRFRADEDVKNVAVLRARGDWEQDESARGQISIQGSGQDSGELQRFDIKKNSNNFELVPL